MTKSNSPALRFAGFDDEWETHAFSDLVDFRGHNSLSRADLTEVPTSAMNIHYGDILVKYDSVVDVSQTDIPFVRDVERLSNVSRQSLSDGDVLFADAAEDSTVGKCVEVQGISDNLVLAGLHTISARPVRAFALGFLGHALNAPSFHNQLLSKMQGTKVSSISISTLTESDFSFPPEGDEQRAIGELFADLDALIEQHRAKHANLQQTKSALMQRMFPQDGAEEPELRLGGYSGHWKRVPLGDTVESFKYGVNAAATDYDGVTKYLRITDLDESSGQFGTGLLTSPRAEEETIRDFLLEEGDMVFARTGATVGRSYLFRKSVGRTVWAGFLIRARFKRNTDTQFVAAYAQTDSYWTYVKLTSQRSGQPGLNSAEYAAMPITTPPTLEEQRAIGEVFSNLDALIAAESRYITQLTQAKTALLQRMFV